MALFTPSRCPSLLLLALLTASLGSAATHTVGKGETLFAIAQKHNLSLADLTKANPGINPARLHSGDILQLPSAPPSPKPPSPKPTPSPALTPAPTNSANPEWLKIKSGDTLSKIARDRGLALSDLRKWNQLRNDTLRPGDLLRLRPTSAASKKSPPPSPASTPPKKITPPEPDLSFIRPAKNQIDAPKNRLRPWVYIVVHHSGTSAGNAAIFDYYHTHTSGMENGLAYHFVIGNGSDSGDGQIEVGPRWTAQKQGGHLASESLNEIAIGICLVGDFSRNRLGPRQTASLIELVRYLRQLMPEKKLKFRLHREINTKPTECPGGLFPSPAIHEILD